MFSMASLASRTVDLASVSVFGVLLASLFLQISDVTDDTSRWLVHTTAMLSAYLFADFASGMVHWVCDTFFEERTPVIGKLIIQPFREHHRDPLAMTRHGFLELNGNNCLSMIPLLLIAWWYGGPVAVSNLSLFTHSFLFTFSVAILLTNQFHRWAHEPAPPFIAGLLQRCRLILNPMHHQRHHSDYTVGFCVTTGWMNPLLNTVVAFHQRFQSNR